MLSIITDTSSLYTPEQAKELGFHVVPLHVLYNGISKRDLVEIDGNGLLEEIKNGAVPSSSQPSIGEKIDLYEQLSKLGAVLDITMAQGLSGTYDSALMAKEQIYTVYPVTVYNSMTICGPQRALVDLAFDQAKKGKTIEEIVSVLDQASQTDRSFLIPRDFDYLKRGGRIKNLEAKVGSFLKLIPVMKKTADGQALEIFSIDRTFKKSVSKIIASMKEQGVSVDYRFYIGHADNFDDAQKAKALLENAFENARIEIVELTPVFIAQGGPGCVSIQAIQIDSL